MRVTIGPCWEKTNKQKEFLNDRRLFKLLKEVMAPGGIAPTIFALLVRRSNQLNYGAYLWNGELCLKRFHLSRLLTLNVKKESWFCPYNETVTKCLSRGIFLELSSKQKLFLVWWIQVFIMNCPTKCKYNEAIMRPLYITKQIFGIVYDYEIQMKITTYHHIICACVYPHNHYIVFTVEH